MRGEKTPRAERDITVRRAMRFSRFAYLELMTSGDKIIRLDDQYRWSESDCAQTKREKPPRRGWEAGGLGCT